MREYKLPYPNKVLSQFAAFNITTLVVLGFLIYKRYRDTGVNVLIEDPVFALFPFFIILVISSIVSIVRYRNYSKLLVYLRIEENSVSTFCEGMFDVTITKQEVTNIKELPNGDLIIEKESGRFGIPHNLPQFGEIKELLSTWRAITPTKSARKKLTLKNTVPTLLFLTSFVAGFIATEAPWCWLLLSICLASGLFLFWVYNNFKENFASRARDRWIFLAIMVLAVIRLALNYLN